MGLFGEIVDLVFFLPVSLCYLPLSWGRRSQGTYSCAAGSPLGLPLIPGASGRGLGRSNLALDPELRAETAGTCSAPARLRTFWELWLRPPSFSGLNRINSLCSLCPHTPNPSSPKWPSRSLQKGKGADLLFRNQTSWWDRQ